MRRGPAGRQGSTGRRGSGQGLGAKGREELELLLCGGDGVAVQVAMRRSLPGTVRASQPTSPGADGGTVPKNGTACS